MPTTSSAASGSSPSSSPASSAPASSASSARRAAASRRSLRAGLLPALAGGVLPGSGAGGVCCCVPASGRWTSFAACSSRARRILSPRPSTRCPPDGRLLLAVDQLEELFTACRSDAERAAFADMLARAAADPEGRAVVVVALRADFYGRFAAFPALAELLGANHVLVGPMQASELRRAVELPAGRVGPAGGAGAGRRARRRRGRRAGRAAAAVHRPARALAEAAGQHAHAGRLPRVRRRSRRRRAAGRGHLRPDPGRAQAARARPHAAPGRRGRGRRAGAPPRSARGARPRAQRDGSPTCSRRWPTAASSPSARAPSRSPTRRCCASGRACASGSRRTRKGAGFAVTSRRRRREWDAAGRDQGELYRGARLAAALDWSADHALDLNELEREFVTESREASEQETKRVRRTNRRLRACSPVSRSCWRPPSPAGSSPLVQRGEARDAETAQLAQRLGAQALVEEDLDLSLLLARQAVAIDDSPQTRGYLLADLLRAPAAVGIMHGAQRHQRPQGDRRQSRREDARGRRPLRPGCSSSTLGRSSRSASRSRSWPASTQSRTARTARRSCSAETGYIRSIDARTRKQLAEGASTRGRRAQRGVHAATARSSPWWSLCKKAPRPGSRSATPPPCEPIGSPIQPEGFTGSFISQYWTDPNVALTPDGRSLVTASAEGELAWWDLDSREKTRTIEIEDGYRALALSPDGLTAAIGLDRGIRLIDVRTGAAREAEGRPRIEPDLAAVQP